MDELSQLAALSRHYGGDPDFVFLGGGNTSFKTQDMLFIKPSGVRLADIDAEDFVALDRRELRRVFSESLPEEVWAREAVVKKLMLAAVRPCGAGRPSVESPVHEVIDSAYVVHLHPALVNGLTCANQGRAVCQSLFPDALWLDYCNPGYALSKTMHEKLEGVRAAQGRQPSVIFLQNHGVFAGADSLDEVKHIYTEIMHTMRTYYREKGVALLLPDTESDAQTVRQTAPPVRSWLGSRRARATVMAQPPFHAAEGPLTPDHMIYARSFPLVTENLSQADVERYRNDCGYLPKVVSIPGKTVLIAGSTLKEARETAVAARDAALVQQLTAVSGGPHFVSDSQRAFIENWEAESYRKTVLAGTAAAAKRLDGRVCLITGAAQGFGFGIAKELAKQGAQTVICDVNSEGAEQAAAQIVEMFGDGTAVAVCADIAEEAAVVQMMRTVVELYGGLDVLVANAGVLRAAPLQEMTKETWDFVTAVNYTGYFLCVKHASAVMADQAVTAETPWMDIVQINSKSGLEGSNRNAAYAGSKFGTIGLTQSFAKELVNSRIKVNSVCPGNFFDGPLWSDPGKGLFRQYLDTGKVPGATTVADVRRFYEKKVPMARGCTPADVVCAILYLIEQEYETGQALPVTGGQVMLK